jgi:presenilin-like A22 family membrane protease
MNLFAAVIVLVLISIYDMIAVWQSKHMVKMAKFQSKSSVFAGLSIPYDLPSLSAKSHKEKISKNAKSIKRARKKAAKPVQVKTAILGGGDIGFPLLFAGVLLKTNSFISVLIVPATTAIALFLLLYFAKKDKFYPAMPFLSAGCIAGLGILSLINLL